MLTLARKDSSVNLEVHPAFEKASPILRTAWAMYGANCVVTSGKDGKHSADSAHYKGQAIDLRISNLPPAVDRMEFAYRLTLALEEILGEEFYVVLEPDHIHLEWAALGKRPNIKGWVKGKNFYVEAG